MSLDWQRITSRRDARILQQFRCATDPPRTERGRMLPHPRPWESEVQAYFRRMPQTLQPEEVLLVGFADQAPHAVAALETGTLQPGVLDVFITAAAVAVTRRGGDRSTADATMRAILEHARSQLTDDARTAVVRGNVHVRNNASQRWLARTGFEPVGMPVRDYQQWALRLAR